MCHGSPFSYQSESVRLKATTTKSRDGSERLMLGNVIMKEKPARKRARRSDWQHSIELQRLREIEKVIKSRHGAHVPDPAGTDDLETCTAYVRAAAMTPSGQDLRSWCKRWAPWIDPVTVQVIIDGASWRRKMIGADAVAKLLFVSLEERNALGLKTIGAFDVPKEQRQKLAMETKRERDKNRQAQKRKAEGRKDRASYEAASISAAKPWEAEGVSRRTWYRRLGTSPSRVVDKTIGDTPVPAASQAHMPPTPPRIHMGQVRVAELVAGLGDHPPAGLQGAAPHGIGDRKGARVA